MLSPLLKDHLISVGVSIEFEADEEAAVQTETESISIGDDDSCIRLRMLKANLYIYSISDYENESERSLYSSDEDNAPYCENDLLPQLSANSTNHVMMFHSNAQTITPALNYLLEPNDSKIID